MATPLGTTPKQAARASPWPEATSLKPADVEELLSHTGLTYEGAEQPSAIQMTCYDILVQTGDKRAAGILHSAKAAMLSIAAAIPDEADRQSFWTAFLSTGAFAQRVDHTNNGRLGAPGPHLPR